MGRAPCCDKVGLKKGRWTAEEDQKLLKYIQEHGEGSWRSLPKNAGLLRCGKSCRLRWINYLRADLKKGNISKEEEEIIIRLHASLGNRWSLIAGHLPGRTDNEIKNYWNSHLSRSILSYRKFSGEGSSIDISKLCSNERKRRRGRTSRSAMKKNNTRIFNEKREREMQQGQNVDTVVRVEQDSTAGINWDSNIDEELLQSLLLEFGTHEERSSSGNEDQEDIGSYLVFGGEGGGCENVWDQFEKREEGVEVVASGGEGDVIYMEEACKVWDQEEELWPWMWDSDGENENGWFGIEGMEIN